MLGDDEIPKMDRLIEDSELEVARRGRPGPPPTKLDFDAKMRITDESGVPDDTVRLQASVDGFFAFRPSEEAGVLDSE